jgi:hypothetical protein
VHAIHRRSEILREVSNAELSVGERAARGTTLEKLTNG